MTPEEITAMRAKLRKAIAEKDKIRGHPLTPQERIDNLHRALINDIWETPDVEILAEVNPAEIEECREFFRRMDKALRKE